MRFFQGHKSSQLTCLIEKQLVPAGLPQVAPARLNRLGGWHYSRELTFTRSPPFSRTLQLATTDRPKGRPRPKASRWPHTYVCVLHAQAHMPTCANQQCRLGSAGWKKKWKCPLELILMTHFALACSPVNGSSSFFRPRSNWFHTHTHASGRTCIYLLLTSSPGTKKRAFFAKIFWGRSRGSAKFCEIFRASLWWKC